MVSRVWPAVRLGVAIQGARGLLLLTAATVASGCSCVANTVSDAAEPDATVADGAARDVHHLDRGGIVDSTTAADMVTSDCRADAVVADGSGADAAGADAAGADAVDVPDAAGSDACGVWVDQASDCCLATACTGCSGNMAQQDSCSRTRTVACDEGPAGCAGTCCGDVCCASASSCVEGGCCPNERVCPGGCCPTNGVPANFFGALTHPHFFARDGQAYVGKRFFGALADASRFGQFMKAWSGPLTENEACSHDPASPRRQLAYHLYNTGDDFDDGADPGSIAEWEVFDRIAADLRCFKYGGQYQYGATPHWDCAFMAGYGATGTQVAFSSYACPQGTSPFVWPNLPRGEHFAVTYQDQSPTCTYDGNMGYTAVFHQEDFGPPQSALRRELCKRDISPAFGLHSNAYTICLNTPYVGRFQQRYAWRDVGGNDWHFGCEPLVYGWGYPESGATHLFFRNGELRWATYQTFAQGGYVEPHAHDWWTTGCEDIWYGRGGGGGSVYAGIYQIGSSFFEDRGDDSAPSVVTTPSLAIWSATGTWYEAYGFKGWEWCPVGTSCDTGWVSGPQYYVECPAAKRLQNSGTFWARDDGLKRHNGTTNCVD